MLFSRNRPLLSRNCTSLKIASDPLQFPRTALISLVNSESPPRIISSPDSEWQFAFCVVLKKKQQLVSDGVPHLQMILINIWWVASLWSANKLWEEKNLKMVAKVASKLRNRRWFSDVRSDSNNFTFLQGRFDKLTTYEAKWSQNRVRTDQVFFSLLTNQRVVWPSDWHWNKNDVQVWDQHAYSGTLHYPLPGCKQLSTFSFAEIWPF